MEISFASPIHVRGAGLGCLLAMVLACLLPACGRLAAQVSSENPPPAQRAAPNIFEDEEVKVVIPPGWKIAEADPAAQSFLRVGHSLRLVKNGYLLALAYNTKPAPGPAIDRFMEIFPIPWLDPAQIETCGFSLRRNQQAVSSSLLFIGFLMDTADPAVRGNCAIQNDIGPRWLAGFFTVPNGGYFLHSSGAGCGDKAYILFSPAKTVDKLTAPNDPALKAIIGEAGRIVNTIRYKSCSLALAPN